MTYFIDLTTILILIPILTMIGVFITMSYYVEPNYAILIGLGVSSVLTLIIGKTFFKPEEKQIV